MTADPRRLPLRRLALMAALLAALAPGAASAAAQRPRLAVTSGAAVLAPSFAWSKHDYVIRCDGQSAQVELTGARKWSAKVNGGRYRAGSFTANRPLEAGESLIVSMRRGRRGRVHRFYVRCLPPDFPAYSFKRLGRGGPDLLAMQLIAEYAAIFDRHGVPVWWFKASGEPDNVEILRDRTVAFNPVDRATDQTGDYEIRRLDGRLVRVVRARGGARVDVHELLLLPNGHYMLGRQVVNNSIDTTPYGGMPGAGVVGIAVQEITKRGRVVWEWRSEDHISLDEVGRWWPVAFQLGVPYDVSHWNAVEPAGNLMLMSFRHVDGVYAISRRTGRIVWKLGGTKTAQSLRVVGDPLGSHPLGGQHDVRLLPDGTISIHDNGTNLNRPPRVVRYRIDAKAGTARMVQAFGDPETSASICCGSARRLPSGDWVVGWGGQGFVGGYDHHGRRLFALRTPGGFAYRANPVPDSVVTTQDLRRGMNAMKRRAG
jgi:Arylsulfotransferase (ASST)